MIRIITIIAQGGPLANFNIGAILLAIVIGIAGSFIGGFMKFFQPGNEATKVSGSRPGYTGPWGRGKRDIYVWIIVIGAVKTTRFVLAKGRKYN